MTLLEEIHAFLARSGMSRGAFGETVARDSGFLGKWQKGALRPSARRQAQIRVWLHDNRDMVIQSPSRHYDVAPSGINVAANPDLWVDDAQIASANLLAALSAHHPERCGRS
ncbi:hypothetical protein SAMN02927924_01348 [Sphingobium faniae]|nr:hypothetical protein SAMN02927924_01348 [Sphingobium faniae]